MNYLKLWEILTTTKINWKDLYHWFLRVLIGDKTKWVPFWVYKPLNKCSDIYMVFVRMDKNTGMFEWKTKKMMESVPLAEIPEIQLPKPTEQLNKLRLENI